MAKKDKDAVQSLSMGSSEEVVLGLWKAVASRQMDLHSASTKLREHVASLPEEKQAEFRGKAREWGVWLTRVSEAFAAELTVIGAGQ